MKRLIILFTAMFVVASAQAQKINNFSLEDAVNYAKQNNVQVRNALIDYKIQQQTNREITAMAYPQINASGTFQDYLDIPTSLLPGKFFGAPGTYKPVQFGVKYNASGGIDASQLLFDGQVFVGLQARKTTLLFAAQQQEVTAEMINVNVQKIYYQLVVGRQQMTSIEANIVRFEKLLKDTREIYKQGFAERLDVDKVSVQLNNLLTEKVRMQSRLDAGNAGLKFLLNMPQKDSLVLTDSITEEKIKLNILGDYKYEDRKEFKLLSLAKKLNEYNIRRYKLSYLPTLAAFGSYNKNAQRQKFDFFNDGPWFTTSLIGLNLTVPIFDGFAKRARVNKAKLELEKTNNNLEQLRSSIDNDVVQARLQIAAAMATMDNQKRNMQLAEEVYNTTRKKYEAGLGSNQEIYNAQAELKVAQNNYYAALYDAVIARVDYLKAIGKL